MIFLGAVLLVLFSGFVWGWLFWRFDVLLVVGMVFI